MAWPTDRILLYDRSMSYVGELGPADVTKRERTEELNGTHELELVTSRVLHEGYRLLTVDNTGKWREHVVYKPDEGHEKGKHATGTYVCMWSLQYDLMGTVQGNVAQPGMGSSCSSKNAVTAAIGGQSIWTAGECDVPSVAAGKGVVMVGNNAWDRLKQVVGAWGGEVDAEITVSSTKVVTRKVVLRAHLGSTKATRRFDWAKDLTKIHRTPDPGPYFCRIMPFGRGQREYAEDDETEFDWPSDVTEEPYSEGDGWVHDAYSAYVRDPEAEAVFRTADGHGGWHYPTKEVKYGEDDPELLLNEATADIHKYTRPNVNYEADVLQFVEAGMDAQGVALGDDIQCVDYGFNPDAALRVQGRVTRMVVNELAPNTDTKLTIGDLGTSFAATLKDLIGSSTQSITQRLNHIEGDVDSITDGGTIAYVESLLESINAEINAMGGYAYVVNGEGIITYDIAVDDPLIGYNSKTDTWASQVVQIKGGNIRIANSKKPGFVGINDWEWKTVLQSGHIAAELITAAQITAGYIGNPTDDFYVNFGTREFSLGANALLGSKTVNQVVNQKIGISNLVRNGDFSDSHNHWHVINAYTYSIDSSSPRIGGKSFRVVMNGSGSLNRCICPNNTYVGDPENNFNHEGRKTYSISFWAKADSANKITCCGGWYASSGATPQQRLSYVWQEDIGTAWKQFTGTLDTNLGSGSVLTGPINFLLVNAGTLYITDVMIVEGEKPISSWAQDIRDTEKMVDDIIDDTMTQEAIFNRLTNNGEAQGLYLQGGKVYINASYIQSGTISGNYIRGGTIEGTVITSKSQEYSGGSYYQTTINEGKISLTYPGSGVTGAVEISSLAMQSGTSTNYAGITMGTVNPSTKSKYGLTLSLAPELFQIRDESWPHATSFEFSMNKYNNAIVLSNVANSSGNGGYLQMSSSQARLYGYYGGASQYIDFSSSGVTIRSGNKGVRLNINSNSWTPLSWS